MKDWVFFTLVQSGVFGKLRRVLSGDSIVLDVGCASGVRWLGTYHTIGVDISFGSVCGASEFYEVAVQARAERLPLAPASVDAVYSSYFFEHLEPAAKDSFLQELVRVLRPGGRCVLLFDVLSNGPFGRLARRDDQAFRRAFVENDGHVGLELLSEAIDRVRRKGFIVEDVTKFGTTMLQYPSSYQWLDAAYGDSSPWIRCVGAMSRKLSAARLRLPFEFVVTALDVTMNRFTSTDHATRAILVLRKARG